MPLPSYVTVPSLCGLNVAMAHHRANAARLAVLGPWPDLATSRHATVRSQHPAPGASVRAGAAITVWIEDSDPDIDSPAAGEAAGERRELGWTEQG